MTAYARFAEPNDDFDRRCGDIPSPIVPFDLECGHLAEQSLDIFPQTLSTLWEINEVDGPSGSFAARSASFAEQIGDFDQEIPDFDQEIADFAEG